MHLLGSDLTGRTRFRMMKRAFGPDKLVLQVEATRTRPELGPYGMQDSEPFTYWRDAALTDLAQPMLETSR